MATETESLGFASFQEPFAQSLTAVQCFMSRGQLHLAVNPPALPPNA